MWYIIYPKKWLGLTHLKPGTSTPNSGSSGMRIHQVVTTGLCLPNPNTQGVTAKSWFMPCYWKASSPAQNARSGPIAKSCLASFCHTIRTLSRDAKGCKGNHSCWYFVVCQFHHPLDQLDRVSTSQWIISEVMATFARPGQPQITNHMRQPSCWLSLGLNRV